MSIAIPIPPPWRVVARVIFVALFVVAVPALQAQRLGQAAHVVVALDRLSNAIFTTRLDHVGVEDAGLELVRGLRADAVE